MLQWILGTAKERKDGSLLRLGKIVAGATFSSFHELYNCNL